MSKKFDNFNKFNYLKNLKILKNFYVRAVFFLFFLPALAVMCWPVDVLTSPARLYCVMPNGSRVVHRYIHSVQLTPVEDELAVVGGRLVIWEERIKSHNAGLPTQAPPNGAFLMTPEWMIVRGEHPPIDELHIRVGDDILGKNTLSLWCAYFKLHELMPSQRLSLSVKRVPLFLGLLHQEINF